MSNPPNLVEKFNCQLLVLVVICAISSQQAPIFALNSNQKPTSTALEIQSKGYLAEDFFIPVNDRGYHINIVKASNPLVDFDASRKKDPILIIHGIWYSGNGFLLDGEGARPEDYSRLNAGNFSLKKLKHLLRDDPSKNSIVYLALNFGHEVYILNRRNTVQARRCEENAAMGIKIPLHLTELKFDTSYYPMGARYWNYTGDDQAKYDLPAAVDFVLESSGQRKVDLIGHSMGGALILMALTIRPELSEKVSQALLWSPSLNLAYSLMDGDFGLIPFLGLIAAPIFENIGGSFPPEPLIPLLRVVVSRICGSKVSKWLVCDPLIDLLFGKSHPYNRHELLAGRLPMMDSIGMPELAQLAQSTRKRRMSFYKYPRRAQNMAVYGQPTPPFYNVSRITCTTMHLMAGVTDNTVSPEVVDSIMRDLKVPMTRITIGLKEDKHFNHLSFVLHDELADMLNIPSLKLLESNE